MLCFVMYLLLISYIKWFYFNITQAFCNVLYHFNMAVEISFFFFNKKKKMFYLCNNYYYSYYYYFNLLILLLF